MTFGKLKTAVALIVAWMALAGAADAQLPASTANTSSKGYVEAVAQSAFGNVTSQSFGAELGATLADGLQLFVEGGMIRDAATSDISAGATEIALALGAPDPRASNRTCLPAAGSRASRRTSRFNWAARMPRAPCRNT